MSAEQRPTLENRVAVITGATGGLGRVVARRFADGGARLALFDLSSEWLDSLADELVPGVVIPRYHDSYLFGRPTALGTIARSSDARY